MLARPMKAVVASGGKNQDLPIMCFLQNSKRLIACLYPSFGKMTDKHIHSNFLPFQSSQIALNTHTILNVYYK